MPIKLLFDTDAFCKLGVVKLLEETAALFSATLSDCAVLPALPHMLRGGRLRSKYGASVADLLIPTALAMQAMPEPNSSLLQQFVDIPAVDPGEVQLFSVSAEHLIPIVSGDKRALRAVTAAGRGSVIDRRLACLEQVLLELCTTCSTEMVRNQCGALASLDVMVRICFAGDAADTVSCLESYARALEAEVAPIRLWARSRSGGE